MLLAARCWEEPKAQVILFKRRTMSNNLSFFIVTETLAWEAKSVPEAEPLKCCGTGPGSQCSLTLKPLILLFQGSGDSFVLTLGRPALWKVG